MSAPLAGAARLARAAIYLYLAGVLAVWALLRLASDAWWPATVLLFAPRWPFVLPAIALAPFAIRGGGRLARPLAAAAIVALVSVMDLRLSPTGAIRRVFPGEKGDRALRVLTYNVGGGHEVTPADVERLVDRLAPDVVGLQECANAVDPERMRARGWHVHLSGGCFLSRFPIRKAEVRDPREEWPAYGSAIIARFELDTPYGVVNFVNVHLATPRDGLAAVMWKKRRGAPALEASTRQRAREAELARGWAARGSGPLLVAGDFNTPVESAIYGRWWSDLRNAYSDAGFGLGNTKTTKWHGVRIDHVLASREWRVRRAWIDEGFDGDHHPLLAEVELAARD